MRLSCEAVGGEDPANADESVASRALTERMIDCGVQCRSAVCTDYNTREREKEGKKH